MVLKDEKRRNSAPAAAPDAAALDVAFPRGGAEALTPLEKRQIEEEAKQALNREAQAGAAGTAGKGPKQRKPEQVAPGDETGGHFLGHLDSKAANAPVPLLSVKRLSVGMRLLAVVLEVTERGLTLSLPHGLRGHVAPDEASDVLASLLNPTSKAGAALLASLDGATPPTLTDLFHLGQYVRCEIIGLGGGKGTGEGEEGAPDKKKGGQKIECSLKLKRVCAGRGAEVVRAGTVLPAVVRGVEDHGFTLEFGIKGIKGFLPRSSHEAAHGEGATLLPGALLDVAVQGPPDARGITRVTSDPTSVAGALAQDSDPVVLTTLLPGTLVSAKVTSVRRDGLTVRLLGVMQGTVDLLHLGPGLPSTKAFKQDQKVKARVLYVDPNTKDIALSLLPHVVALALPSPIPMLGQAFDSAPVLRVDEGQGLLLSLPLGGELGGSCPAFCHATNVAETRPPKLSAVFKAGSSQLKCRVIGFRLVDGLATVSATKAALEQQIMSMKEISPGQVLSGKVASTDLDAGLLVEVAPHVTALVPVIHMSDLGKESARKKFKVGQQVQGRVLNVDPSSRKLSLTLKPGLLGSKLPTITSALHLAPGTKSHGVVTGITDYGVYVTFFGGVCGMAHVSELGLSKSSDKPSALFTVGQVVRARVLSADPASGRVRLSLKSGTGAASGTGADPFHGLQPGDIVDGRVVREEDGGAGTGGGKSILVVEVWREGEDAPDVGAGAGARLELPGHLADHPGAQAALQPLVSKPGVILGPLVVLERLEGQKVLRVSCKASLVAAARVGRLPTSLSQVQEGALLSGYVAGVTDVAVFVRLGAHVTGRAGLSQLADSFVSDPHSLYSEGQSVRAQVVTVDEAKGRFTVTLKPSLTASSDASYLASLYSDLELAADLNAKQSASDGHGADLSHWSRLVPGAVVDGTVHEAVDYGLMVDLPDQEDLVGVIRPSHYPKEGPPSAPGAPIKCRILDVAKSEGILDLSARSDLIISSTSTDKASGKKAKKQKGAEQPSTPAITPPPALPADLKLGQSVTAVVELLKDSPMNVAVLSLPSLSGALVYAATTDFNSPVPAAVKRKVVVGSQVEVKLQVLPDAANGGRLLAAIDLTINYDSSASSGKDATTGKAAKLTPGSTVEAKVTAVTANSHADVVVGKKTAARIHVTEVVDLPHAEDLWAAQQALAASSSEGGRAKKRAKKTDGDAPAVAPELAALLRGDGPGLLKGLEEGKVVQAVVLPRTGGAKANAHSAHRGVTDLSIRPSVVAAVTTQQPLPAPTTFASLSVGRLVAGVVTEKGADHVWVSLSPDVRGRLHVLDASQDPQVLSSFKERFPEGRVVAAHVAHVDAPHHTLDLTLLPLDITKGGSSKVSKGGADAGSSGRFVSSAAVAKAATSGAEAVTKLLSPGVCVMGSVISGSSGEGSGLLRVSLGGRLHGQVALTDIYDDWRGNALEGLSKASKVYVRAVVLGVEPGAAGQLPRVKLTLRVSRGGCVAGASAASPATNGTASTTAVGTICPELLTASPSPLAPGTQVRGYVKRADAKKGVFVTLDRQVDARIKLCNLSDGFVEDPVAAFPQGLLVEGRVVACAGKGEAAKIEMSLKSSDASRTWKSVADFHEGDVVQGRVRRVEAYGVFVELAGSTVVGLAHISELVDGGKVKDINALFRPQQTVKAKVVKVDTQAGKISLSLKPSQVGVEDVEDVTMSEGRKRKAADLDEEMAEEEEEGAQGRAGVDDASDEDDDGEEGEEEEEEEEEGAVGKGAQGGIDDLDLDLDDDEDMDGEEEDGEGEGEGSESEEGDEEESGSMDVDDEDEGEDDDEDDDNDQNREGAAVQAGAALRRQLAASNNITAATAAALTQGPGGAVWGGLLVVDDNQKKTVVPAEGVGREDSKQAKGSKAARKKEAEEAERKIREAELARLKGETAPQSVVEFEQSVLASPNSSYTWIRYMAWLLGLGEVDKARAVAQRALDTIQYREDGEKFNVWVAWLNLEAASGPPAQPTDALMALFNKAVQYCDQKKIYFALLGILTRGGHTELEASTLKAMCKRFGGSCKVWLRAMESGLSHGAPEGVKPVLQRALQALPKRKHIKVITSAALLEFRTGSAERGRSIMEGVLINYPKRLDLWSVYVDQELKLGDVQRSRALFERATSLSLPPKKIKFLFKRWLDWEKSQSGGNNATAVEHVKQRAMEFVQSHSKA